MNSQAIVLDPALSGLADTRARAFAAARRHTRRVRLARRALEIGVAGVVVAFVALALYRNFARTLRDMAFDGIGIEGGRIMMDKPRLSGSRPGGGGYAITAVKALQDPKQPGIVDLVLIGGDITMPDKDVSKLYANTGHYESAHESLDLDGDVQLKNSHYEISLQNVHIDFKSGAYVSKQPVNVRILPDTTITADAFSAKDNGAEAHFDGRVHTLIQGVGGDAK